MKYHQNRFHVQAMVKVWQVSASGLVSTLGAGPRCEQSVRERQLVPTVLRAIHAEYDAACGNRRTVDELTTQGRPNGRHRFTQI